MTSATEVKEEYITVTGLPLPVAWWRFDEASGNTAIDSSGNDNDGTIAGGSADRRAGACGTGLYFDGSSTWVSVPDDDTLGFSDTFTFAGWFRPEVPINYPNQLYPPYNTQIIGKGYDKYQNWKGPHLNNYEIFLQSTVTDFGLRQTGGMATVLQQRRFFQKPMACPSPMMSGSTWQSLLMGGKRVGYTSMETRRVRFP
ncbi:hypothetical protein [Methanogenium cariaci]|uniref:hypothetical protein n=1 Tax=Methanogenium cariaci TaxID=2197 RepID=UPI000781430F|nr:hypothetical protein [Methanogenium cariaci]